MPRWRVHKPKSLNIVDVLARLVTHDWSQIDSRMHHLAMVVVEIWDSGDLDQRQVLMLFEESMGYAARNQPH